jgi:hypothetical protein
MVASTIRPSFISSELGWFFLLTTLAAYHINTLIEVDDGDGINLLNWGSNPHSSTIWGRLGIDNEQ